MSATCLAGAFVLVGVLGLIPSSSVNRLAQHARRRHCVGFDFLFAPPAFGKCHSS
jgi:hypothetical protein